MRNPLVVSVTALAAAITISLVLRAEMSAQPQPAANTQNRSSKAPDLSGDWAPDRTRGGIGQSLSLSDIGGRKRGNEDDIPYQPWAREKTMSEKPSTGTNSQFDETTDPQVIYCTPA